MKKKKDPRHKARILALQKLFEEDFLTETPEKGEDSMYSISNLCEINHIQKYDKDLFENIIKTVNDSKEEIDSIIQKFAP